MTGKGVYMFDLRWLVNQGFGDYDDSLSILDLINSGTVDCKLAALLWVLMEHRVSVLVAAGPSFAGKTTLLHALLDLLPPDVQKVPLQGYYEDFTFTECGHPEKTYMIAEEISNHGMAEYLWGYKAVRAFKLMSQGYAMGSTIHARNSQEVIYILHKYLGLTLTVLTRLGIVVNLQATAGLNYNDEPIRRVSSVDLILPCPEGLTVQVLAARKYTENGFDYLPEKRLCQVMAEKSLMGQSRVNAEINTRMRFLKHLLKKGETTRKEVRKAVLEYYRSGPQ
jgi:hypothetical protein